MPEAETFVCRSAKQTMPAMRIRTELNVVSELVVLEPPKPPIKPRLKISSRAPKTIPLIPASESMRLVVSE